MCAGLSQARPIETDSPGQTGQGDTGENLAAPTTPGARHVMSSSSTGQRSGFGQEQLTYVTYTATDAGRCSVLHGTGFCAMVVRMRAGILGLCFSASSVAVVMEKTALTEIYSCSVAGRVAAASPTPRPIAHTAQLAAMLHKLCLCRHCLR
jgi:hypothetical protein